MYFIAFGQAVSIATSLVKFPQESLLADRRSTYNAAFVSSYERLLNYERNNAKTALLKESVKGAKQFISGTGRHGSTYNLKPKQLPDWEVEFDRDEKSRLEDTKA